MLLISYSVKSAEIHFSFKLSLKEKLMVFSIFFRVSHIIKLEEGNIYAMIPVSFI